MKRLFIQFLFLILLLLGAFVLLKNKLKAPWSAEFNNVSLTNFERLMVSGPNEDFEIMRVDSNYLLAVNGLSYPIGKDHLVEYFDPLKRIRSSKRIKKKRFDVLESKGYLFDFSPKTDSIESFGIFEKKGSYYYQSRISKDYFLLDSSKIEGISSFSFKSLLPNAVQWDYDNQDTLFLKCFYNTDTLAALELDSLFYAFFEKQSTKKVSDTLILADWAYRLEITNSANTVSKRFNLSLDTLTNKIYLEQLKPFSSRIELDSIDAAFINQSLFGF